MKLFVLSILFLTSSLGFAGPLTGNSNDCFVGGTVEQVENAKSGLNAAGQELVSVAGGDQAKAVSAIDRVTKPNHLSDPRFDTARTYAKYSVVNAYMRLDHLAVASCDRGETIEYFRNATEILVTAQNGLRLRK